MRIARNVALMRMTNAMRSSNGWEQTSLVRERIRHGGKSSLPYYDFFVSAVPPIFVDVVGLFDGVVAGTLEVLADPEIDFFGLGVGLGVEPVADRTSNSHTSS